MILSEIKNHTVAYLVLLVGIVIFCYLFFSAWPDHFFERLVIVGFAIFYFVWGLITHQQRKQITPRVVSEYAVVSLIGALLLLMLTF